MVKLLTYSTLLLNTLSFTPQRALEQQYTDFNSRILVSTMFSGGSKSYLACDFGIASLVDDDKVSQTEGYTPEMYYVFRPCISQWSNSPSDTTLNFDTFTFEDNFFYLDYYDNNLDYLEFMIDSIWNKPLKQFDLIFNIEYHFTDGSIDYYEIYSSEEIGEKYLFATTSSLSGVANFNSTFKIYRNQLYNYFDVGVDKGFDEGLDANSDTQTFLENVWTFVDDATTAVFNVLDIQILPGIPLYSIVIIPLCICLLFIVMKWLGE